MPFGSEGIEPGTALALSGGGYRATLFHAGALWRLNETGRMSTLKRVSSISGGSITAGALAVRWNDLTFAGGVATDFEEKVVNSIRKFCETTIDVPAFGLGALLPGTRASDLVEVEYRKHLLGEKTLRDLPDEPRFVINATNLATGASFRFSKPYAGDYLIGMIRNPTFLVSQAVAASSAFPPVLSPMEIEIDEPDLFERTDGAELYDDVGYREKLWLTDGGVYDNLGLETVWKRFDTVLVSDAGAPFDRDDDPWVNPLSQLKRTLDIAMDQVLALRKRILIGEYVASERKGTYWGIGTEIADYGLSNSLPCPAGKTLELSQIRTRLDRFDEKEQCELINWGYAVSDAALRRYVDPSIPAPAGWPYPEYALDR